MENIISKLTSWMSSDWISYENFFLYIQLWILQIQVLLSLDKIDNSYKFTYKK